MRVGASEIFVTVSTVSLGAPSQAAQLDEELILLGKTRLSLMFWSLLHRIRKAIQTGTFNKLSGDVEVDGTLIGGLDGRA